MDDVLVITKTEQMPLNTNKKIAFDILMPQKNTYNHLR